MKQNLCRKALRMRCGLTERELILSERLSISQGKLLSMVPNRQESWKDPPALRVRRLYEQYVERERFPNREISDAWLLSGRRHRLTESEIRMGMALCLKPEKLKDEPLPAALFIRRQYEKRKEEQK